MFESVVDDIYSLFRNALEMDISFLCYKRGYPSEKSLYLKVWRNEGKRLHKFSVRITFVG